MERWPFTAIQYSPPTFDGQFVTIEVHGKYTVRVTRDVYRNYAALWDHITRETGVMFQKHADAPSDEEIQAAWSRLVDAELQKSDLRN